MKVMKFGGSTIKDTKMIHKVADVIKNEKKVVVVVSALYGQTNEIREFVSKNHTEKKKVEAFIRKIRKRHERFAEETISDMRLIDDVQKELDRLILKLERLLFGVAYVEELTPRTSDLILSTAERMSAYIMEGVLLDRGIKAKAYESDRIGVVTDGLFGNATAKLEKTERNLKKKLKKDLKKGTVPVITGVIGKEALGGLLAGVTASGVLMALFMANAGGAWDNAKKTIEAGAHGGKGSDAHKAAVVGDTVGDPFKDTAGPSLNILIKLMAVVSVVIAPLIA